MTMPSLRRWLKAGKRALTEEPCETFAGGVTEERKGEKMPPGDFLAMSILAPGHFVYSAIAVLLLLCAQPILSANLPSLFTVGQDKVMIIFMMTLMTLMITLKITIMMQHWNFTFDLRRIMISDHHGYNADNHHHHHVHHQQHQPGLPWQARS